MQSTGIVAENRTHGAFARLSDCAPFCAHPTSITIANDPNRVVERITCIDVKNQHDSNPSHSISLVFGRSLNQRVGGSSPPRFTI